MLGPDEQFIHQELERRAESMARGMLGHSAAEFKAAAFYWPNEGDVPFYAQLKLPEDLAEKRLSICNAIANVRAYGVLLMDPRETEVVWELETPLGCTRWRLTTLPGSSLLGLVSRSKGQPKFLGFSA